jgi:hypothetical protein
MRKGEWALLHREMIPNPDGSPYINRFRILMTPWFSMYLHHIYTADLDRDLHDHPFNFTSTILRGGYIESVARTDAPKLSAMMAWPRWSTHRMTQEMCHRIEAVAPRTLTLILVGRRRSSWGFYTDQGYVEHDEYFRGQ